MKKILFVTKDLKSHCDKDCSPVEGTLAVGNLFNTAVTIIKRKIKFLLFNKLQFNVSNYTGKCDTAYVELNPDFIETLLDKQNNKFINVELGSDYSGTPLEQLVSVINDTNGFIVNNDENYIFTLSPDEQIHKIQYLFKLGKGTWGDSGVPITVNDFIEIIQPTLITGSTDNPLADNGIQVITPNVKNILVYNQQLEFVNSVVEPNTSTLKLKDSFVDSLLTQEEDPVFTASPAASIEQNDIDNWNNNNIPAATSISIGLPPNISNAPAFFYDPSNLNHYYRDRNGNRMTFWYLQGINGITTANNKTELGGVLYKNTEINTAGFTFKLSNLTNAQGDSTFTKQVVAKPDGTFGVEDKSSASITQTILNLNDGFNKNDAIKVIKTGKQVTFNFNRYISFTELTTALAGSGYVILCTLPVGFRHNMVQSEIRTTMNGYHGVYLARFIDSGEVYIYPSSSGLISGNVPTGDSQFNLNISYQVN
jgi:hypothetical protein